MFQDNLRVLGLLVSLAGITAAGATSGAPASGAPPQTRTRFATQKLVSISDLRDRGDETPLAAIETFVRAAARDDRTTLVDMMRWTWRENAHHLFADVPAAWAARVGSPEQLIAVGEVNAFARVTRVQLFESIAVSDTELIAGIRTFAAGEQPRERLFWMRQSGGRWLRVVTSTTIARLARDMSAGCDPDTTDPASFAEQYRWIVPQTGPKPPRRVP